MDWKPIIVGVDDTPESVRAAVAGAMIAQRSGASCRLVSAVPDYEKILLSHGMTTDAGIFAAGVMEHDRALMAASLTGYIPECLIQSLEIRNGNAPLVIGEAAHRLGAGLIVLGSRQLHGPERLAGGTVRHLVRTCDIPLLVTNGGSPVMTRVLVALDLSPSSARTFEVARRYARLFGARLRAIHVVEPMPMLDGATPEFIDRYYKADEARRTSGLWARLDDFGVEKVIANGRAASTIMNEVADFQADLLVIGSHGRGWVDRLLIGSTAEQLLHRRALMTLVVPSGRPWAERPLDIGALPWEEREPARCAVPARS